MKLLSATVSHYRIHKSTKLEFDPSRTLVGGPNESGKSTFAEALHRGLFLKSRITGAALEDMKSTVHVGAPGVEIYFESGSNQYRLVKVFQGQSGSTQLTEIGGESWKDEAAESKLNELLGVDDVGGGRNILERLKNQWGHLWVWQGESGSHPSQHVAQENSNLIQRLQSEGAAAVLQSALDTAVADWIETRYSEHFTKGGKQKAGSDLASAQEEERQAYEDFHKAEERLKRLEQAIQNFEQSETGIMDQEKALVDILSQKKISQERIHQLESLQNDRQQKAEQQQRASQQLELFDQVHKKIESLKINRDEVSKALAPESHKLEDVRKSLDASDQAILSASRQHETALEHTRNARLRFDWIQSWKNLLNQKSQLAQLLKRQTQAKQLKDQVRVVKEELQQLPDLTDSMVQKLRKIESRYEASKAVVESMAARIEIKQADLKVTLDGKLIQPGAQQTISESTELQIGDAVIIQLHPGGGGSLTEAREKSQQLKNELAEAFDKAGIQSIEKANEAAIRRTQLIQKLEHLEEQLKPLDDGDLEDDIAQLESNIQVSESELNRRREKLKDEKLPDDSDQESLKSLESDARETLDQVEMKENEFRRELEMARQKKNSITEQLTQLENHIRQREVKLQDLKTEIKVLEETHGNLEKRQSGLETARQEKQELDTELAELSARLNSMQPDLLRSELERLHRAEDITRKTIQDLRDRRAESKALCEYDGSNDPQMEFETAHARLAESRENLERENLRAGAIQKLTELFRSEKETLSSQLSQPLADRISIYLRALFGAGANAVVKFEGQEFQGIQLYRPGQVGAFDFSELSGGTREQVAAAVRLAVAELLACDHDNSLPIVFDDAFAYSDPDRVQSLQCMLDLAANRGLQIIILTCNPSDYALLGTEVRSFKTTENTQSPSR